MFGSYLLFVAFMFAFYVLANNAFGAEGRHWYPFIFPAFLCFVWYAPHVARTRRRTLSAVFAGALCCYSLVAAGYALVDVTQRYYGPPAHFVINDPRPSQLTDRAATGTLWAVKSASYHVADGAVPVFATGSNLIVAGAALPAAGAPSVVAATLDGHPVPLVSGEYQFMVAEATRNLSDAYSQFFAQVSTRGLAQGAHVVDAYAETADGQSYRRIGVARTFFLTEDGERFSTAFVQRLERAPLVPGSLQTVGTCKGFSMVAGGTATVHAGGVALLAGTLGTSRLDPYRGVWLLVDGRPYQSRYDERAHTFVAAIPTADLAVGIHRAVAYAITDQPGQPLRIAQTAAFSIVPGRGADEYLAHPPVACSDPLHQLAGLGT